MKKHILIYLAGIIVLSACGNASNKEREKESNAQEETEASSESAQFVNQIEKAHKKSSFLRKGALQFDMKLIFGGKLRFDGSIKMTPNGDMVKMQDSSRTIYWDGATVKLSPDTASEAGARFDVLTWSYFFAAPFKLSDPGVNHEYLGSSPLAGESFKATKMTFDQGVGDSPDDWYIVYKNQENDLLAAMAYIVTYSKSQDVAEQDPHAITYEAYTDVDGIPFATQWNFWSWNSQGETQKLLGEAIISNINFIEFEKGDFIPATASKVVEKPAT